MLQEQRRKSQGRRVGLRGLGIVLTVGALLCAGCGDFTSDNEVVADDGLARIQWIVPAEGSPSGGETVTIIAANFTDDFGEFLPRVSFDPCPDP